jgi:plasmid stabilization system protein ParE
MAYKVRLLPAADDDLISIDEYMSQFYKSTPAKFFAEFDRIVELLVEMPQMYPRYPDTKVYRKENVMDYIVLYRIIEVDHIIEIHAVWHGARDIEKLIKKLPKQGE